MMPRNENTFVLIYVVVHFRTLGSLKMDQPIYLLAGQAFPCYVEGTFKKSKTDLLYWDPIFLVTGRFLLIWNNWGRCSGAIPFE